MTHVTLPTTEQLDAAGFDPSSPSYPPVTIDGVTYRGLRDVTIGLVPQWAERQAEIIAICRAAAKQAAHAERAAEARRRLAECDHWALKAAETGEPLAPLRRGYRNALRAIAAEPGAFTAWPSPPSE